MKDLSRQSGFLAAVALIALSSLTVFASFVASNAGLWSFSPYLLIPSILAWVLGVGFVMVVHAKGGDIRAASIAGVVGALLFVGGGWFSAMTGPLALPAVPVAMAGIHWVLRRLFGDLTHRIGWWLGLALVLVNGYSLFQIVFPGPEVEIDVKTIEDVSASRRPDVFVLVLDEFASVEIAPLTAQATGGLHTLTGLGYQIHPTIWSSYTVSAAAVASVLDGTYPLVEGEVLDDSALTQLGQITRGESRLVSILQSEGYHFTMVESGLWMSECGPRVDTCIHRAPIDEAMGVLLERSVLDWWYKRFWGHAFIVSGMHSMEQSRAVLVDSVLNQRPDLVISHVMLPHVPYLLDSRCRRHGESHDSYGTRSERLGGYQRQAACVVEWLADTLREVDHLVPGSPAVVAMGDHGTNFSGQLTQPVNEWDAEDIVERLGSFAVSRFPAECPSEGIEATPQLVDRLLTCLTNGASALPPRHFLVSYGDNPVRAVEYPHARLEFAASSFTSDRRR